MTDTYELAWLAGFWDGEGCVTRLQERAYPVFALSQAGDEGRELCARAMRASGLQGSINGPYLPAGSKKPKYVLRISGVERVSALLEMCRPWLSRTKIEQAEGHLGDARRFRAENGIVDPRARTHCPAGHELTEENVYQHPGGSSGKKNRVCRTCHRIAARAAYQRKKAAGASDA